MAGRRRLSWAANTAFTPTIRFWRDKYAGMESSDLVRMKQLEAENAQMRRIITRQAVEIDAVKELISKNGWGPSMFKKRS